MKVRNERHLTKRHDVTVEDRFMPKERKTGTDGTQEKMKAAAERTKVPKPLNLKLNVSQHSSSHH